MPDRDRPIDMPREGGQATRVSGGPPKRIAMGRGYGRNFGDGGLNQGFEGSHGLGYGGSVAASDYREGVSGEDFGDDRNWVGLREGPYRGRGPRTWSRNDSRIREEVCERLLQDRLLDARGVDVNVQDGVVTLEGEVPGASDVAHAEMVARGAPGVADVRNGLRYRPGRRGIDPREGWEPPRGGRGGPSFAP